MEYESLIDSIFKRRSIRKYTAKEVENEKLVILLKAAMAAPKVGNRQPWEFIVVNNREKLNVATCCLTTT